MKNAKWKLTNDQVSLPALDSSRFDQTIVTIFTFVEYSETACIGIAKYQELIWLFGKSQSSLLSSHGLNCITTSSDDSWRTLRRFESTIWFRRDARRRSGALFSIDDLLL